MTLVYLREHTTYAKLAAGFRISEGTAYANVQSVIKLLAARAPSLTQALGSHPVRLERCSSQTSDGVPV
ncbi:transposase family protein [Streptomyces rochei]|uniref:helix-turn-helix domain-containing protein n=1 Tax=Streptomyces rochei TaxID=1928 RepID=UPI0036B829A2